MVSVYFNSEIVGNTVPYAERMRGVCCRPLHYFFEGQTREWYYGYFEENQVSYPAAEKSWPTSLKMAVLIVPGLVVGTIAAVVAVVQWHFKGHLPSLCLSFIEISETLVYTNADRAHALIAPRYELGNFSLHQSHEALQNRWIQFASNLNSADRWQDATVRTEFTQIIQAAYKEMNLLFQHANRAANGDSGRMAEIMADQHTYSNHGGENYCRAFFYNSIGQMYYAARSSLHFRPGEEGLMPVFPLSRRCNWEDSQPFFTPGTPEYRWRQLYNAACALIDRYPGLREALKRADNRFLTCAIPDFAPSSYPPRWTDIPTC